MNFFDVLTLIGGLCLFLFGMNVMGQALERKAGGSLRSILKKLTSNKWAGLLTGIGVTAVVQSSSAVTVMVVGFVNSGLMALKQAINVIMGANIGTTITAWILSLSGIDSNNFIVSMFHPMSFTPILAAIGIIFQMTAKNERKKETGLIFLGFATLMFGMDIMSDAVSGLRDIPEFCELFLLFENPILGVLVGALLTALIQSSSASVGVLQALSVTGQVSYGAAIPIIMGQNIGTCVTAMISAAGANKNARRAAGLHLLFNILGTTVLLTVYSLIYYLVKPVILELPINAVGIAVIHSIFNFACVIMLFPLSNMLEKLIIKLIPDKPNDDEKIVELDERLLSTPSIALEKSRMLVIEMAEDCDVAVKEAIGCLTNYSEDAAEKVNDLEKKTDHYEDALGSYLVKLSSLTSAQADSTEAANLLKAIGDFERISDHAMNIIKSADEIKMKNIVFTEKADLELKALCEATIEIMELTKESFVNNLPSYSVEIEALEQVIDEKKEQLRSNHILRLQNGICTIEAGFVWSDLLTNIERISDHCSNISIGVLDMQDKNLNVHQLVRKIRGNEDDFNEKLEMYERKYGTE